MWSTEIQSTISPVDGTEVVQRKYPTEREIENAISASQTAFSLYKLATLDERIQHAERFLAEFEKRKEELALDLANQIGRPLAHGRVEVDGTISRGKHMIAIAKDCLADATNESTDKADHVRFIKRVPVGPVLVISPWNFPYFCQVNAVLPAILAGNSVLLKPSPQTPLAGERFAEIYATAGLPENVLQVLHLTPTQTEGVIKDARVQFVQFTGSVANGHMVAKAAADTFKGVGLELGGKDPAYVRQDANLDKLVPGLAAALLFNSGQSCCSVERIYVHESIYDEFLQKMAAAVKSYKLGDPREAGVTLGPVVSQRSAEFIRKQIAEAESAGAKLLVPEALFSKAAKGTTFVAPQIIFDCDHSMSIMKDETFGPVAGVMKVASDEEAIKLMNDSPYGLTASVWTNADKSRDAFLSIASQLETGTVFLNNADNLDPALAWSGVKDSGRGVSLSKFGFDAFTRTKSINMRL